jgi:hypothetical protein
VVALGYGCGTAPRNFEGLNNPSGIVRARATSLGYGLHVSAVVPMLIDKLGDPDPVVRLAAHEELKEGSGQDFGFLPWAGPEEREQAIARWRAWWSKQQASLAKPALAKPAPIH